MGATAAQAEALKPSQLVLQHHQRPSQAEPAFANHVPRFPGVEAHQRDTGALGTILAAGWQDEDQDPSDMFGPRTWLYYQVISSSDVGRQNQSKQVRTPSFHKLGMTRHCCRRQQCN